MKGAILGYDGDSGIGAISGDDGLRYRFTASAWRANEPPISGSTVDFDIAEIGSAADVYLVATSLRSSAAVTADDARRAFDRLAQTAPARRALETIGRSPVIVAAAVALLASFGPAFVVTPLQSYTLASIGDFIHQSHQGIAQVVAFGGEAADPFRGLDFELSLGYLVYGTPIMALTTLAGAFRAHLTRLAMLGFAGSCIFSFSLAESARLVVESFFDRIGERTGIATPPDLSAIHPGFGAWLILASGLATFGLVSGLVRIPVRSNGS